MEPEQEFIIYTIGFSKKPAQSFFEMLKKNGVQRVVDIRLRNTNQLAGFAKKDDLQYFLKNLIGCEYYHFPFLAPSENVLNTHQHGGSWETYVRGFVPLMKEREAIDQLDKNFFKEKKCCLLCSEHTTEECHRRIISEMLAEKWGATIYHIINENRVDTWKFGDSSIDGDLCHSILKESDI